MEHSDKIVMWGMSCVGKTTFAKRLSHDYLCFDAMFPWHDIETLGLSIDVSLDAIRQECERHERFVLDGWHLADPLVEHCPRATIYVVYAPYEQIISQYRVPVDSADQHYCMFKQWYDIGFPARYFLNRGEFVETTREEFLTLTGTSQ